MYGNPDSKGVIAILVTRETAQFDSLPKSGLLQQGIRQSLGLHKRPESAADEQRLEHAVLLSTDFRSVTSGVWARWGAELYGCVQTMVAKGRRLDPRH